MHRNALTAAAAAAHNSETTSELDSPNRYEARVSALLPVLPHLVNQDTASPCRPSSSSSKAPSILPPLTHPHQVPVNEENAPTPPHETEPTFIEHWPSRTGAEPGVNPRRDSSIARYSHFKQECLIDVIDYDSDDASFERLGNADFINMMNDGYAKVARGESDPHPKAVRWINIAGIDWDVLSSMALRYHIHALALEDVLHEQGDIQSKADYFPDHLFIRILCHIVGEPDDREDFGHHFYYSRRQGASAVPPAYGSTDFGTRSGYDNEDVADLECGGADRRPKMARNTNSSSTTPPNACKRPLQGIKTRPTIKHSYKRLHAPDFRTRFTSLNGRRTQRSQEQIALHALTSKDRVCVRHEPMYMFLFHDGTVISIMPTHSLDFTAPITERLYSGQSVLRTSEDASLLIEALLDLVVDRVLELVEEYQKKIQKLEHDIMLSANVDSIRSLHVISADLMMHNMTLEPIKTMIYNLRRYDTDRCIAMANHFKAQAEAEDESELDSDVVAEIGGLSDKKSRDLGRRSFSTTPMYEQQLDVDKDEPPPEVPLLPDARRKVEVRGEKEKAKGAETKKKKKKRKGGIEREERLRWEQAHQFMPEGAVKGYLSYTCKLYLSDVGDHMNFVLTSFDMFAGVSQNLMDFAFNMASYEMNKVMSRLTLVTIIFLPPTLLAGYFGMNFSPFASVDGESELLFWKIALPSMAVLITLFMFYDMKSFAEHLSRQWKARTALMNPR